jgi:hypothetical protein
MKTKKTFDCVEMKRRIQKGIYEETKAMNHQEFGVHMRKRIAASRFASFLERPVPGETHTR